MLLVRTDHKTGEPPSGSRSTRPVDCAVCADLTCSQPPPPNSDRDATLSLGDALILAVTERLGCMVLTRDGYWTWMVDEGHLKVLVAIP